MKYKRTDLHGLLVLDKPLGLSSMDVVRRVRSAAGHCKTGHAGTLDPLATGVLVCCLGRATKSVPALMGLDKQYEAEVNLSAFSETDDAEGPVVPCECPEQPSESAIDEVLSEMVGDLEQVPPAYSAIKVGGKRAYRLARSGKPVEIKSRIVRIRSIQRLAHDWPYLRLRVECGKGTYIRSLARQIGQALRTGGYLTALRRTAIGPYRVEEASAIDALPKPLNQEHLLPVPDEEVA